MSTRRYKKSKGGKSSSRRTSNQSYVNQVVTMDFYEQPWQVTQASSGTGGISSMGGGSGASITSVGWVAIDPFTIGGRFAFIAGMYTQYRINYLNIDFIPDSTASGYLESIAGGTTTPVLINRDFAWGLVQDPAVNSAMTATQILISGGRYNNTTRRQTLSVRNLAWMFTTTTSSYSLPPSTIDFRLAAPLALRFAYKQTSTTGTQIYGDILVRCSVSFRGPLVYIANIGLTPPSLPDEKKDDHDENNSQTQDSPILISSTLASVSIKPPTATPKLKIQLNKNKQ